MQELWWFLPGWPLVVGQFVVFGALLIGGLLGGELAQRLAGLPRITGYVVVGILAGPEVLGLLRTPLSGEARAFIDLALGLVVFELGHRLDVEWLRRNPWLALAAVGESLGAFFAIYGAMLYFGYSPLLASGAAAVGTATSPAVVMLIAHELRASGQITERAILFTAVNCAFAFVALTLVLPFLHLEQEADLRTALLHPIYLLGGALLLGFIACQLMLAFAGWLGKREDRQFILLIALVVLVVGLARATGLTVVVALLAFGVFARNLDYDHVLLPLRFGYAGQLLFVLLFVLTGASLEFYGLQTAWAVVACYVLVRFLGKALAILVFGRLSGLRAGGAGLLSVALVPMSGVAVIMVHDTEALFPGFGAELAAVVLSAAALLELIGPLATQLALRHAGEAHPEEGAG
ncbi:MAG TPA: cation:proton antiporter [Burkholderiales bacterium]|jgi:Kef-type K+ transport system membrane component KefB|nr:cation:proton antiporter [Burkholderiales bacterium]